MVFKKNVYLKKFWKEGEVTYYFHFESDYVVRQIEIYGSRILKFSLEDNDIVYDQSLSLIEQIEEQDIISEQEFERVWHDSSMKEIVQFISYGDIFTIEGVTSYAHGCNCAGAMGAGIALQFKNRFPEMYQEYHQLCKVGKFKPGDVYDYDYGNGHVYNLGTQETWHSSAKLEYVIKAFDKMMELAEQDGIKAIALPAIAAGPGGLQWDNVRPAIKNIARYHPKVCLYVVEKYKPNDL